MSSAESRRLSTERVKIQNDTIVDLEQLNEKKISIPTTFHMIREAEAVVFLKIDTEGMPRVICSIKIFKDLDYQIWSANEQLNIKDVVYGIDDEPRSMNSYSMLLSVLHSLNYRPDTETKTTTTSSQLSLVLQIHGQFLLRLLFQN